MRFVCVRIAILAFAFVWTAVAQRDTGAIVGTVKDSTGASIPSAQVKAEDTATSFTYTATTDTAGDYVISPVRVGTYRITVSAQGFQSEVAEKITLEIQQRARMDFTLHPGDVKQTMEVTTVAPVLETDTSERGQVITSQYMQGLPLNGRNPVQLAQLTAGVVFSEPGARDESGYGFSANGARSLENNFLLDGIDNNSNLPDLLNETNYVVMPSVDALQEFKVQTNTYSAELGRANGAVVNATVKSGTNDFHGVLYEFLRNDKLDARNFFDPARPGYKQNQFGGTLGGRILRDRLFFFGDYEGLRVRQAQTETALVPDALQRSGDFSEQLGPAAGVVDCNGIATYQGELFDTRLTQASASSPTGYCGVPFGYDASGMPTNVIPLSRQDPLGQKLMALYPTPNAAGNGYNYVSNPVLAQDRNQGDVRIDQVFSNHDTAFYRFSMSRSPTTIPGLFPGLADGGGFFSGIQQFNGYNAAASETHAFSPTRVNELRLGYNRLRASRFQFNYNTNVAGQIGFPGVPYSQGSENGGLPQLTFSDASNLGSPTYLPSLEIQNTFSYSDTLTLIHGAQSWKIGGEFRPEEFTIYQPATPRGSMDFGPVYTDNPAAPGTGGSGLASFLAGQPDGGSINNLHNVDYTRKNYAGFVQNDWRVSKRLTVNLGLRYEFFGTVKERFGSQANFNPLTGQLDIVKGTKLALTPTFAQILPVNPNATGGLVHPDYNNFAPRVGFAYQASSKLVVRSAFGMFYNASENGPYSNPSPGFNPPFFVGESFNAPCGLPAASAALDCSVQGLGVLANGFPANALVDPNTPTLFSEDPNMRTPYVAQWHFTLQYELGPNSLFEAAYVGSKGTKLYTFGNVNQASPTADPSAPYAPRRPFPQIDTSISYLNTAGNSEYDALQTRFQHRFSGGLSLLANYTWSHALGDASNANLGAQNNDSFRWWAHPEWEHGNLDFDVRHRFVLNYVWELPYGRTRHWGSSSPAFLNGILGDWTFSGITLFSQGTWYTVTDANGNFANSDGQQRPDATGQSPTGTPCVPGTFFNTCAFTDPALGSFGNVGINTVRGPGLQEWDMALEKEFPIGGAAPLRVPGGGVQYFQSCQFPVRTAGTAEF